MRPLRYSLLLVVLACLGASGCATVWAGIQLGGSKTYSTDGHEERVTAAGLGEQALDVEVRSLSPLVLGCTLRQRRMEHVEQVWHRWGFGWKMVGGFWFVGESVISTAGLVSNWDRSDRRTESALSAYLAADALATGALLWFLEPESSSTEFDRGGPWVTQDQCPNGLVVYVGNEASPVDSGGGTPVEKVGGLVAGIVAGAPISVAWQTRTELLLPTREERCAWAQSKGDPLAPAICPHPPFAPPFAPPLAPPPGYLPPGEPGPPAYRSPDGIYPGRWRIELTIPGVLPPAPR